MLDAASPIIYTSRYSVTMQNHLSNNGTFLPTIVVTSAALGFDGTRREMHATRVKREVDHVK